MFITKKHVPRRTFLRGAGVTVAIPLLESMLPAFTPIRLTAAAPTRRFVGIWHPHGAAPGYWSPLQEGRNFEFSFITKPLEPYRNRVMLVTGLDMPEAMATDDEPGGDHARGAVLLSGARPRRNAVSPYLGTTIDQTIAAKYGQDTILSSIQLGVEDSYGSLTIRKVIWVKACVADINFSVHFDREIQVRRHTAGVDVQPGILSSIQRFWIKVQWRRLRRNLIRFC